MRGAKLTLGELAAVTEGRILDGDPNLGIQGVITDSRGDYCRGALFVALRGGRFDGHNFVQSALVAGAAAALVETPVCNHKQAPAGPQVRVGNTLEALGRLAAWHRSRMPWRVVAVTGSCGKTTTKDLIAGVLSAQFHVAVSPASYNNHIGVPLTLLSGDETIQVCVVELGSNHPGEIRQLARLCRPHLAVITGVGASHLEGLQDEDGVFAEKTSLLDELESPGMGVLCTDDPRLASVLEEGREGVFLVGYGLSDRGSVHGRIAGQSLKGTELELSSGQMIQLPMLGRHNAQNALAAETVAHLFGMQSAVIAGRLSESRSRQGRMKVFQSGDFWLVDDTYNANPHSVSMALDWLRSAPVQGNKILVLGDMMELGGKEQSWHEWVGKKAVQVGVDYIVGLGEKTKWTLLGAVEEGLLPVQGIYCTSPEEVASILKMIANPGDLVLVKGSRAMRMERVVSALSQGQLTPA
ncbi:MAG: UDP-N-acetylmuramoyl-tripeptide--D-alanyl-D-alanine ligase [Candidatus Omnitrophica bacterium]|nr:UDP-N-acetylmuramoyl-tripeptide--D-alanyl-D-alanine ligase [Candidatus Omnitrophota bacterium]